MDYNADIFIETPLHLIFHGIFDDVVKAMHKFMSEHDMLREFKNLVNRDLSEISTLRLEWCKTKELPKKLWLGENELAYARIVTYVYAHFFLE